MSCEHCEQRLIELMLQFPSTRTLFDHLVLLARGHPERAKGLLLAASILLNPDAKIIFNFGGESNELVDVRCVGDQIRVETG